MHYISANTLMFHEIQSLHSPSYTHLYWAHFFFVISYFFMSFHQTASLPCQCKMIGQNCCLQYLADFVLGRGDSTKLNVMNTKYLMDTWCSQHYEISPPIFCFHPGYHLVYTTRSLMWSLLLLLSSFLCSSSSEQKQKHLKRFLLSH